MSFTLLLQAVLGAGLLALSLGVARHRPRVGPIALPMPATPWGRALVALLLALGGLATLAGAAVPFLAFFASCLALPLAVALGAHALATRHAAAGAFAGVLAAMSLGVALSQPLGLKVLALPRAAVLPVVPVPARVVKTYDEGLWFEGIAAADDGTLYLSGNRGLDFSRSDYFRAARGELIARRPDGAERIVFRTPTGATAGVPVVGSDGTLYLTSHGEEPTIWRIPREGEARVLARLPRGAWPNGLDLGPDGQLYAPDSALGLVWRIDPATGRAERALVDPQLLARPLVSLAPGANGGHFRGRDLLVTVSDRTTVLKYTLDAEGRFGPGTVVATGIPGDDFAVASDGTLYVTTHPYDTVVEVTPDGRRRIIAGREQHIVGATDAVFGRMAADRDTLYVVTDGGAFTGGPRTRGELVALKPAHR